MRKVRKDDVMEEEMLAINDLIKLFHERKLWGGGTKLHVKL